jgi:hypothetical protein
MVAAVERDVENPLSARSARFRPIRANSQFVRARRRLSRSGLKPKIAHVNSKPRHVFHRGNRTVAVNLVQCTVPVPGMSVCQVFFRDYEIHNRVRETEWCQKSHRHTFTFTHTRSHLEEEPRRVANLTHMLGRWLLVVLWALAQRADALKVSSTNLNRRGIMIAALPLAACSRSAKAVDSKGRSEGVFGERGLLTEMFGVVPPPTTDQPAALLESRSETTQEKMARIRKERMAAEARNQSDEYRRLQAGVGTKSFGSTVSVPIPRE